MIIFLGIVIGGCGMGENLTDLCDVIRTVRIAVGKSIPILVQGLETINEVIYTSSFDLTRKFNIFIYFFKKRLYMLHSTELI